jgi:hypothetical protein
VNVVDATNAVHVRRIDPTDWKPILDAETDPFIGRIRRVTGVSRGRVRKSLQNPEHEFDFSVPFPEGRTSVRNEGLRVFGHEFGKWSVISIWENDEYTYHATVQIPHGMEWEKVAITIFQRWIETRPTGPGAWGVGKSGF